jgi:hypothetical protein
MNRRVLVVFSLGLLAACSRSSSSVTTTSQSGAFALQSQGAGRGGEARVALKTQDGAAVTVVSELNYDTHSLSFKQCSVDPGAAAGKSLSVAEPSPGKIRAVLAGNMAPLSAGSEVLRCTFAVAADASAGKTNILVHGESADASFTDSPFSVDGSIEIGS